MTNARAKIAILWRGDRTLPDPLEQAPRLRPIIEALEQAGLAPELAPYNEYFEGEIRDRLLTLDAVLVWVDPLSNGKDRRRLDSLLREVAAKGVFVSAHPDTILKMGTKEVLFRTRHLGWGTDTHLYKTLDQFRAKFPARLRESTTRVLKQYRGNGGQGVWRVELVRNAEVRVVQGRADAVPEDLALGKFIERCEPYFAGSGLLVDQAYQPRIAEGLVRCYFVQNRVVGFARQAHAPETSAIGFGLPSAKTMFPPDEPQFHTLRANAEGEWVPAMQKLLDIPVSAMPIVWDADFLFGPKTEAGNDSYVLCEINVSAVLPIPPNAPAEIARAVAERFQ